jgi:CheY-like chemotaxis protein
MEKKVLLIEDDQKKIDDIENFMRENYNTYRLTVKESYQSGLRELMLNRYDLLLLDMSLPTWGNMEFEGVGSFEKFGGYKIMKELVRKKVGLKTILITMFDDFGESDSSITLNQIDDILKTEFTGFYLGYVFYNSRESNWKNVLADRITTNNI